MHISNHGVSYVQEYQEKVDNANEKLTRVANLLNKIENMKVKQQTLAKQNGEAYARFVVRSAKCCAQQRCAMRKMLQVHILQSRPEAAGSGCAESLERRGRCANVDSRAARLAGQSGPAGS